MTKHYHELWGFHGCIPESNDSYMTIQEARNGMKFHVSDLRDGGNRLKGNLKDGYFEIIKKTDALCDYGQITECFESSCFDEKGELRNDY